MLNIDLINDYDINTLKKIATISIICLLIMQSGSVAVFSVVNFISGEHHSLTFSLEDNTFVTVMHHTDEGEHQDEGCCVTDEHHQFYSSQSELISTSTKNPIKSPLSNSLVSSHKFDMKRVCSFLSSSSYSSVPITSIPSASVSILRI